VKKKRVTAFVRACEVVRRFRLRRNAKCPEDVNLSLLLADVEGALRAHASQATRRERAGSPEEGSP
jgi:hypothetical protein